MISEATTKALVGLVVEEWSWSRVFVKSIGKVAISATMADSEVRRIFVWVFGCWWPWLPFMGDGEHTNGWILPRRRRCPMFGQM
jgi:hypothetical protein